MKYRPILFSAPMVRAILEGKKTMTRRVIKHGNTIFPKGESLGLRQGGTWCTNPNPDLLWAQFYEEKDVFFIDGERNIDPRLFKFPYGKPGERLWVRETWTHDNKEYVQTYKDEPWRGTPDPATAQVYYRASEQDPDSFPRWIPSIYMPRWASRITLEITNVRVERLQDISEEDARAEGVQRLGLSEALNIPGTWKGAFADLWVSINGPGSWDANPWVWVVEFKREVSNA